ncbi:MAG: hypothetical protein F6K47_07165 [Symploca sp. SIO2E6]|nr:hypothetical protein [Symploca sp. SIO2E6]
MEPNAFIVTLLDSDPSVEGIVGNVHVHLFNEADQFQILRMSRNCEVLITTLSPSGSQVFECPDGPTSITLLRSDAGSHVEVLWHED